jgi:hypothetical protein
MRAADPAVPGPARPGRPAPPPLRGEAEPEPPAGGLREALRGRFAALWPGRAEPPEPVAQLSTSDDTIPGTRRFLGFGRAPGGDGAPPPGAPDRAVRPPGERAFDSPRRPVERPHRSADFVGPPPGQRRPRGPAAAEPWREAADPPAVGRDDAPPVGPRGRTPPPGRSPSAGRTPPGRPVPGSAGAARVAPPVPPPAALPATRRARAGAELRRQLRAVARLRAATLSLIVAVVLGAPVGYFAIRWATRDPVFAELDAMDLPNWAAGAHTDDAYGSLWCIRECRFRERTWASERGPEETAQVYEQALRAGGWRIWSVPGCPPEGGDGYETCWQRDEYVLDLWVRIPVCAARPTVGPLPTGAAGSPAGPAVPTGRASNRSATPTGPPARSASQDAVPPQPSVPAAGSPSPACPGSVATVKVFNRIDYVNRDG